MLIFLPGWNQIFALMRHMQAHPVLGITMSHCISYNCCCCCCAGSRDYVILPCHSQIPREDQRRVFEVFPSNVTKVSAHLYMVTHTDFTDLYKNSVKVSIPSHAVYLYNDVRMIEFAATEVFFLILHLLCHVTSVYREYFLRIT